MCFIYSSETLLMDIKVTKIIFNSNEMENAKFYLSDNYEAFNVSYKVLSREPKMINTYNAIKCYPLKQKKNLLNKLYRLNPSLTMYIPKNLYQFFHVYVFSVFQNNLGTLRYDNCLHC